MEEHNLVETLKDHLANLRMDQVQEICRQTHPAALAESLREFTDEEAQLAFSVLSKAEIASLFEHLSEEQAEKIAKMFTDEQLVNITSEMASDDRVDFLKLLGPRAEQIIRRMARTMREDILRLGSHAEGTAGAIMTSEYAILLPKFTVRRALDALRLEAPDKETIYYAYVVDEDHRLLGLVSLKRLILSRPDEIIENIMRRDLMTAHTEESQVSVAEKLSKYDLLAIPIITDDNTLVGIVTFDDILDFQEQEATNDFHKMGTVGQVKGNVRDTSVFSMFAKRIPWLLCLVFVNFLSGAGIAYYEHTIQQAVALVFFLPLLIGSGGNAGSQSATLMVRALATGDVRMRDWFYMLQKEVAVALLIGLGMAAAVSVISFYRAPEVAVVVMVTMLIVVLFGSLLGMSMPFIFTKLKMDPATASVPLITSIADICGVLIYFSIASWYLNLSNHF